MKRMAMNVDLPDAVADRITREATRRGLQPEELAVSALDHAFPASDGPTDEQRKAAEDFLGSGDSGDPTWASRNIHELRSEFAERKLAEGA